MPRPRRRAPAVETIFVPHEYMVFADRRIDDIVRRCCRDQNIVESVARSCYLQGLWDGVQVALDRPELLVALKEDG
jgi:hypothetical protein